MEKINDVKIMKCVSLKNIDLSSLKINDKILELNYDINVNGIVANYYLLEDILLNSIYIFKNSECNFELDIYSNTKIKSFLVIKNKNITLNLILKKIKITNELMHDILYKKINEKFIKNNSTIEIHNSYSIENNTIKSCNCIMINIDNNNKLFAKMTNDLTPNIYKMSRSISFYIINNDASIKINLNIDDLIIALNQFNDTNLNECINLLKCFQLNYNDFIKDPNNIELIVKSLKHVDNNILNEQDIRKYFEPVLIEDDIKCYFSTFYSMYSPTCYVDCDMEKFNNNIIKIINAKTKANSILRHLTGNSKIDIYSGNILNEKYTEFYKDNEYLVIARNLFRKKYIDNGITNFIIYKLIDNIYVELYKVNEYEEAKKIINDRLKLLNCLSD